MPKVSKTYSKKILPYDREYFTRQLQTWESANLKRQQESEIQVKSKKRFLTTNKKNFRSDDIEDIYNKICKDFF